MNRIKTFVKNHDIEIASAFALTGVVALSLAYLHQVGMNVALNAKLEERGKSVVITSAVLEEFAAYHVNNPQN